MQKEGQRDEIALNTEVKEMLNHLQALPMKFCNRFMIAGRKVNTKRMNN
jgi:hypothetical protein